MQDKCYNKSVMAGGGELETDRNVFFLNHGKFIVDTKSKTSGGHNKRKSQ